MDKIPAEIIKMTSVGNRAFKICKNSMITDTLYQQFSCRLI